MELTHVSHATRPDKRVVDEFTRRGLDENQNQSNENTVEQETHEGLVRHQERDLRLHARVAIIRTLLHIEGSDKVSRFPF